MEIQAVKFQNDKKHYKSIIFQPKKTKQKKHTAWNHIKENK